MAIGKTIKNDLDMSKTVGKGLKMRKIKIFKKSNPFAEKWELFQEVISAIKKEFSLPGPDVLKLLAFGEDPDNVGFKLCFSDIFGGGFDLSYGDAEGNVSTEFFWLTNSSHVVIVKEEWRENIGGIVTIKISDENSESFYPTIKKIAKGIPRCPFAKKTFDFEGRDEDSGLLFSNISDFFLEVKKDDCGEYQFKFDNPAKKEEMARIVDLIREASALKDPLGYRLKMRGLNLSPRYHSAGECILLIEKYVSEMQKKEVGIDEWIESLSNYQIPRSGIQVQFVEKIVPGKEVEVIARGWQHYGSGGYKNRSYAFGNVEKTSTESRVEENNFTIDQYDRYVMRSKSVIIRDSYSVTSGSCISAVLCE